MVHPVKGVQAKQTSKPLKEFKPDLVKVANCPRCACPIYGPEFVSDPKDLIAYKTCQCQFPNPPGVELQRNQEDVGEQNTVSDNGEIPYQESETPTDIS